MKQEVEPGIEIQKFWNEVGSEKNFNDPFFLDKFSSHVNKDSDIIEYGCGYGRILNNLWNQGYQKLTGFDFAPKMLEKGNSLFPQLNLQLIKETGKISLEDAVVDATILSTVLCCNPQKTEQEKIINEIHRILRPGGILYFCDFLITPSEKYLPRYEQYAKPGDDDFGVYRTNEGVLVCHFSTHSIFRLLRHFDILWLEQIDDQTMNGNSVRTVHLIAQKI